MKILISVIVLFMYCAALSQNADSYLKQGTEAYSKGNYTQSVNFFKKCAAAAQKENNPKAESRAYNNIGNALAQTGKTEEALAAYQSSLNLSKAVKDHLSAIKTSKNIGVLYAEQKDFAAAMRYYTAALEQSRQIKDALLEADCLNNMGVVFEQQENFNEALRAYKKALEIYRSDGDDAHVAMTVNNLAIVYKCLKDYSLALNNYNEALQLSEKQGDAFMVAATLNNMGNVYILTGDYKKALQLCSKAYQQAEAIQAVDVVIEACDGLAVASEKLGQYAQALKYRKLYEQKKDSFINTERSAQLADMQVKYETHQKEGRIKLLTKDRQIQTLKLERRNKIIFVLALFLGLFSLTAYFWRSRQQLKEKLEKERLVQQTEEQERRRLARDIHDDLGSGLTKINFLSELILRNTQNMPEVQSTSLAVQETARKMVSNMRDLIWALNPENTTLASLVARIREYASDYLEETDVVPEFNIADGLPEIPVNKESHRQLLMVVKEVLNNTARHSGADKVIISISVEEKVLRMEIKDNGKGFNGNETKGNGLKNIDNRITVIGGSVTISSEPGTGTTILIITRLEAITKKAQP